MSTLLQSISAMIDKITVTDRQEENITNSVSNLDTKLKNEDSNLYVNETFTTGSWERDTIIRPLDDVDIFCVLDKEEWEDENGELPNPQSVLTKMRNYLNGLSEYKDKVSQDRPCVTIYLSDKNFDVLPCFNLEGYSGYHIPNNDLKSWTISDPATLEIDLTAANKKCNYKLKGVIRAIKYWNRENDKLIPSFHIEESAIELFQYFGFTNEEEAIRKWFNNAVLYSNYFKSYQQYEDAKNKIDSVKDLLNEAKRLLDEGNKAEAMKTWKAVFGKEFPLTSVNEAKSFSEQFDNGILNVSATGAIGVSVGTPAKPQGGFYGEVL